MSDWKSILSQIAPTIATALGGPLAGAATAWVGNKLLGKPNATQDDIAAAISDPDTLLKLKTLDLEYKQHLADLGVKLDELDTADRASARSLAIAKGISPQVSLSALFVLGYFGILAALICGWAKIPQELHDVLISLIAILAAGVAQVMNFWFGSTRSSQDKDKTLADIASAP
jgi:hypothetical protein